MAVGSKETGLGEKNTEPGDVKVWRDTFYPLENGKKQIGDKWEKVKQKFPEAVRTGPGSGVAYLNFTFHKKFTREQWDEALSKDADYFYNKMGYKGGNKYRGRGIIQITHAGTYDKIGRLIGVDLTNNPELIAENKDVMYKATVAYLALTAAAASGKRAPDNASKEVLQKSYNEGLNILNSKNDYETALKYITLLVAGVGHAIRGERAFTEGEMSSLLSTQLEKSRFFTPQILSALSSENKELKTSPANQTPTIIIAPQTNTNRNTIQSAPPSQPNVNPMLGR
jgi:hypothetical protein